MNSLKSESYHQLEKQHKETQYRITYGHFDQWGTYRTQEVPYGPKDQILVQIKCNATNVDLVYNLCEQIVLNGRSKHQVVNSRLPQKNKNNVYLVIRQQDEFYSWLVLNKLTKSYCREITME